MSEPKTFASLGPSLIARKGGARPAMRPQLLPIQQSAADNGPQVEDDLGWNDMGEEAGGARPTADVVAIVAEQAPRAAAVKPAVVEQQETVVRRMGLPTETPPRARRSALSDGRRAAFTLRVDAERHLKLRLACTLRNRSAQQLVTEALDHLLGDLPDLAELAAQVARRRT
jgi:hypothetical protein